MSNQDEITKDYTLTQGSKSLKVINKASDGFTIKAEKGLTNPLTKTNPYRIEGEFLAKNAGKYRLKAELTYNNGQHADVSTRLMEVTEFKIIAEQVEFLPEFLALHQQAKMVYIFSNPQSNLYDAVDLYLSYKNLSEVFIVRQNIETNEIIESYDKYNDINNGYPVLKAGEKITLSGFFIAEREGAEQGPEIVFRYREKGASKTEEIIFDHTIPGNITIVERLSVSSDIDEMPPKTMEINQHARVAFIFTNTSQTLTATIESIVITTHYRGDDNDERINFEIVKIPEDDNNQDENEDQDEDENEYDEKNIFKILKIASFSFIFNQEESRNIKKHLGPQERCAVIGNFIAKKIANVIIKAELIYVEGENSVSCETHEIEIKEQYILENRQQIIVMKSYPGKCFFSTLTPQKTLRNGGLEFNVEEGDIFFNPFSQEFVCVGNNSKIQILRFISNKPQDVKVFGDPTSNLKKVFYNDDLRHYIAIGDDGDILLSEDGSEWTQQRVITQSEERFTETLNDICWSSSLQNYIVVGNNGVILMSREGKFWHLLEPYFSSIKENLVSVTRCDERRLYIALVRNSNGKGNQLLISNTGHFWQVRKAPYTSSKLVWNSIVWGSVSNTFVLVGDNRAVACSRDGLSWDVVEQLEKRKSRDLRGGVNFNLERVIWDKLTSTFFAMGNCYRVFANSNPLRNNWEDITSYEPSLFKNEKGIKADVISGVTLALAPDRNFE